MYYVYRILCTLCDKRIKIKKRLSMMYGSECWAEDRKIEEKVSIAEMRIVKWMSYYSD